MSNYTADSETESKKISGISYQSPGCEILDDDLKTYKILENKIAYQWSPFHSGLPELSGLNASAAYYATRYIANIGTFSRNYYQQKKALSTLQNALST